MGYSNTNSGARSWLPVVACLLLAGGGTIGWLLWRTAERHEDRDTPSALVAEYPAPVFRFGQIELGLVLLTEAENKNSLHERVALGSDDMEYVGEESFTQVRTHFGVEGRLQGSYRQWAGTAVTADLRGLRPEVSGGQSSQGTATVEASAGFSQHHCTSYLIKKERLRWMSDRVEALKRQTATSRIGPNAGFLTAAVSVQSSCPCLIKNFAVNVKANGRLWRTFSAREDAGFCNPLRLNGFMNRPEEVVLTFRRLNTQEIMDRLLGPSDRLELTLEVPDMTVEMEGMGEDPQRFQRMLPGIRARYALVEVVKADVSRTHFIRTSDADGQEIRLQQLLSRIPDSGPVEWRTGPLGYYLARFGNEVSPPAFAPHRRGDAMWLLFLSGRIVNEDPNRVWVRPGDYLRLQLVTGKEYWGDCQEWQRYVKLFSELREERWAQEDHFWAELNQIGGDEKPWDAVAKEQIRRQAQAIYRKHKQFFRPGGLPSPVRDHYRSAGDSLKRFRHVFTEDEFHFPHYSVTVREARVWWNTEKQLNPYFTLTCGDRTITGDVFTADEGKGNAGTIRIRDGAETRLDWSPLDNLQLKVADRIARVKVGPTLCHVKYAGQTSLLGLLKGQELEATAAPSLSKIKLLCRIERDGQVVSDLDLEQDLQQEMPRVIPLVPPELFPQKLAYDFWLRHQPWSYYRSAVLFEDLYLTETEAGHEEAALAYLARAMIAYARAYAFDHCADLARSIPQDEGKAAPLLKSEHWPGEETLASLRELGEVAAHAQNWSVESESWQSLASILLDNSSCVHLHAIVADREKKNTWPRQALQAWKESLEERVQAHSKITSEVTDRPVRSFMERISNRIRSRLARIKKEL